MAKFVKQKYYNRKGEEKVNCYHVSIPKFLLIASGIDEKDELEVHAEKDKIIIQKATK